MRLFNYLLFAVLYCYSSNLVLAQLHENNIPLSASENLSPITNFTDLDGINYLNCNTDSTRNANLLQFACPISTNLDPENSGQWIETTKGKVWRLGIRSANAYSLYLHFQFALSKEVNVFVYAPGYKDLRGAFSSRNNNSAKILSIAPVQGDKLIVEINLPTAQDNYGQFKITKVYHDFMNIFSEINLQDQNHLRVNNCGEDINCVNGKFWQTEKRSVCKIISNGGIGTGTLIGNTSKSDTPYLLTANHLISSPEIAASSIFLFNYETSGCKEELSAFNSLSGAELISTTDRLVDFSLLKLTETPPLSFQPYYVGWDARNLTPLSGVCIHHPFGGYKQIAIEYHPLVSEDIGQGFDANSTWKVSHWEVGTTEEGSSGAPLFNENHRLIGTLTGGRSSCSYPKDDYFTKFGVAWDTYSDPSKQLRHWLDPGETGQFVIDGYDPYGFNNQYCDTAWNFTKFDDLGLSNSGLGWGWVSGHNSEGFTQFAERFESGGTLQLNGVYLDIAKAYSSHPLANIKMKIWEGDQHPDEVIYSKLLFINDLQPNKVNYVSLDSVIEKSGTFFVGYEINYDSKIDTFALNHTVNSGLTQPTSMFVYKGNQWYSSKDHTAYALAISLGLGISECYGKSLAPKADRVTLYPNPSTNSVTLEIPDGAPIYEVNCFDNNGRRVSVSLVQNELGNKLFFDLPPGVYHLKIRTLEKNYTSRFVVLK